MRKPHLLVVAAAVLALAFGVVGAKAHGHGPDPCATGTIASGTYQGFTVTGTCTFADGAWVTIKGDLTIAPGAVLNDHAGNAAVVHVIGDVRVGQGAVLGLGSYDPAAPRHTTVEGDVVADRPASLYLSEMHIKGSLTSHGGGDPTRNFPIKDIIVDGNITIQGWTGLWLGVIRDTVGGTVIVSNNTASDTSQLPGSDSTEVVNNDIGGDLICFHNTPVAQIGDAEQPASRVAGQTLGECAGL